MSTDNNPVAVRAIALAEAVKLGSASSITAAETVIRNAKLFLDFLNGSEASSAAPTSTSAKTGPSDASATKASAPKPTKAVSGSSTTGSKEAKAVSDMKARVEETETAAGASEEDVAKAIANMLSANKKAEAIALLAKFGAKSKSTLTADHYADFLAGAEAILLDA